MGKLFLFNSILIAIIALGLWLSKKYIKTKKAEDILLLVASLVTVLFHYSSMIFYCFSDGSAMDYLRQNPNLVLPIYPCNVVMWSCVVYAFCKNKSSGLCAFLADYIFWFGIFSTLVGMFANVDFIREPSLANYEVTKSIVAHATLLFNLMLLPIFGRIKIDLVRNMKHILISTAEMLVIGLYCNLLFSVIASDEVAYNVNSMFLIHSPFAGVEFLVYPVIVLIAIPLYFGLFAVCERFALPREQRFCYRIIEKIKSYKKRKI